MCPFLDIYVRITEEFLDQIACKLVIMIQLSYCRNSHVTRSDHSDSDQNEPAYSTECPFILDVHLYLFLLLLLFGAATADDDNNDCYDKQ